MTFAHELLDPLQIDKSLTVTGLISHRVQYPDEWSFAKEHRRHKLQKWIETANLDDALIDILRDEGLLEGLTPVGE